MTNEAVCLETPTKFARYTVIDGTAIPTGTILRLSGADLYAEASATTADVFAGIAWEEKTASDGITEISAALNGVWDITCNAGTEVTIGAIVSLSGANLIRNSVEADFPLGYPFGKALEAGSTSEVIRVRVGGGIV